VHSEPELLTAGELSAYLRVHTVTICRLAMRGEIPSFRIGRGWRFNKTTVDIWLREQQKQLETHLMK
jgi:PTS system nitrogen regulatory IIA component